MFLIRWIRELLAIPFVWAGRLAATFKLPVELPLFKAAWYVSRNGQNALAALVAVHRHQGAQAATLLAQSWMQSCPRPEIAAFGGLLALDAGDLELAKAYLQQGHQLGSEQAGSLEMLEFFLVIRTEALDATSQLAERFSTRSDLPAHLSMMVLTELVWRDMRQGHWDAAAAGARHLLAVADSPGAEAALWALALQRGDRKAAQRHLARVKLPAAQRAHYLCMGSDAIGERERARELLEEVRQADAALAQRTEMYLRPREATV
jgi:hypothetical protein